MSAAERACYEDMQRQDRNYPADDSDWWRSYDEYLQQLETEMNINEVFPSDYLKAADLKGHKIRVVIENVEMVEFQDGSRKPCIRFVGKEKGMVMNKTNAMIISSSFGPDTAGWAGKEIILYPAKVPFQGTMTDALRVEIPMKEAPGDDIGF